MAASHAPSAAGGAPPPPPPAKFAVAWECTVPASCAGLRLHEALQRLQPEQFPTMTAAKMAVRRRTIHIDGQLAANPSHTLTGGKLLQCMLRVGAAVQLPSGDRLARAVAADAARIVAAGVQLQVLYEDEHMACVIKPQGVPCDVPPGRGSGRGSEGGLSASSSRSGSTAALSEAGSGGVAAPSVFTLLAHTLQASQQVGALRRPRHVHRLDEPTGGLLLAAKTRTAQQQLSSAFGQRQVHKRYRALVWGRLEGRGLVTYALDGRHCETEYAAVQHTAVDLRQLDLGDPAALEAAVAAAAAAERAASAAAAAEAAGSGATPASTAAGSAPQSGSGPSSTAVWITTIDLWPHTGRKHQLRRHMALLGHPLVGEPRYSFGYALQRLQSGQEIAAEDHRRLPHDVAPDAAMAGAAKSAAALDAAVVQPVADALGPERALLRLAAAKAAQQHSFPLCLWALELVLDSHPATGEPLHLQMAEPPLFAEPCTSSTAPQVVQPPSAAAAAAAASQLGLPPAAAQLTIPAAKEKEPLMDTLKRAGQKALGGGVPGAAAMAVQVLSLMWLRTTVNYQYRYGTTTTEALKHLYRDGGVVRFYRGLGPALLQGPLSRFGDTAANAGMLALLQDVDMPVALKTMAASGAAASFRIFLMPVDAMKTIMQVEGKGGFSKLMQKVKVGGPTVLYHGALAASAATFVGHYPWFFVYNSLNESLPQYTELPKRLLRSAVIGFCASAVSDTCSNSIRVVKTTKQAATEPISYTQAVKLVVEKDGVLGLFGRGLKTKIIANGMQGLMFSVLWRLGQDYMAKQSGGS